MGLFGALAGQLGALALGTQPANLGTWLANLGPRLVYLGPWGPFKALRSQVVVSGCNLGPQLANMGPRIANMGPWTVNLGHQAVNLGPQVDNLGPRPSNLGLGANYGPPWGNQAPSRALGNQLRALGDTGFRQLTQGLGQSAI